MYKDICEALLGCSFERIHVIDLETTGLSKYDDEILSIAITDGYGNELLSSYVKPNRHTSWPEAQRVNHITPEMVENAPTIRELGEEIFNLIDGYAIVGYNLEFDGGFIARHVSYTLAYDFADGFDVMKQFATIHGTTRWRDGSYKWSKLVECAEFYDYEFSAHDALEDARATAYCFRALLCDEKYYTGFFDGNPLYGSQVIMLAKKCDPRKQGSNIDNEKPTATSTKVTVRRTPLLKRPRVRKTLKWVLIALVILMCLAYTGSKVTPSQ
ncbi:MAG: 3'-5' exonuclease [Coriobacteriales bacterium]|nr:3'-5' exonuclease [Coriobacteriales bacterium]